MDTLYVFLTVLSVLVYITMAIPLFKSTNKASNYFGSERLRVNCEKDVFKVEGESIRFTISLGVSDSEEEATLGAMYKAADEALYKSKNAGRNQTTIY